MPGMALFPDPDHAAAFQRKELSLPRVGRHREAMEIPGKGRECSDSRSAWRRSGKLGSGE